VGLIPGYRGFCAAITLASTAATSTNLAANEIIVVVFDEAIGEKGWLVGGVKSGRVHTTTEWTLGF
jgi:hypothetical protein